MAPSYDEKSSGNERPDRSFNLRMFQGPTWSKFSYLEQDGINLLAQNDNMKSDESWSVGGMIEFDALQQNWGCRNRVERIHPPAQLSRDIRTI